MIGYEERMGLDACWRGRGMIRIICEMCDAEMTLSSEAGAPMMLITGDVETGSIRYASCKVCGHREVLKD